MSKAKLKKELDTFSREQLMEMILNLYSARKEAKEYFDFFLNPDCEKLLEKHRDAIKKEAMRAKRGQAKFRITAIKRIIKSFESYDPGAEYVLRMMLTALSYIMVYSIIYYYTDAQDNSVVNMAKDILAYGDKHELLDKAVRGINDILNNERGSATYLRQMVREELAK